jgi:1-acyl-sn-glycerol-3-phosphate acyltransferase
MGWLRAAVRFLLVALLTALHVVVLLAGSVVIFVLPRLRARWRMGVFRSWSRCILPVMGVRVAVRGQPPQAPFFLVANHLSYLDIPVIGSQVGAIFVAKSEIASWPGIGFMCRAINTIFIDRNVRRDLPRVMRRIDHELGHGMGVVLFPEGTSSKGASILPFRPSLLESAARSDTSVSWATLSYRTPPDEPPTHLAVCWWGGMDFTPHALALARLRRIDATIVFGDEPIHDTDRKQLANRLRAAMLTEFEPVVVEEES